MLIQKNQMEKEQESPQKVENKPEVIIESNEVNVKNNGKKKQPVQGKKPAGKELAPLSPEAFQQFFRTQAKPQLRNDPDITEQQRKFIKENIVPLNNKHSATYSSFLRESLINQELHRFQENATMQQFQHSIQLYLDINLIYRECAVNSPVLFATYLQFQALWLKQVQRLPQKQAKQSLIRLWRDIPYQNLQGFLQGFHLYQNYYKIPTDIFVQHLANDLFESHIQQAVEYYHHYTANRKLSKIEAQELEKFEQQQLIPRLIKKDQLFAEYVLNLLRKNKDLGRKIYEVIDISEEEKLMNLVGDDPKEHKRVVERAARRNYYDMVSKNKRWEIIEDKISYSNKFLHRYANQILGKDVKDEQESDRQDIVAGTLSGHQSVQSISKSIIARIKDGRLAGNVPNRLYKYDYFGPAELLLQKMHLSKTTWKKQDFIEINEESVIIVDKLGEQFKEAAKKLMSSDVVGFDSEFMPTETKFEEGGVSIIQLATRTHCYILDYQFLRNYEEFIDFFIAFMENPKIIKVGHTFSSDLQYLSKNFPKKLQPQAIIDITKLFKDQFPQEIYSSLAYLTNKFLGKQLCKYQQRSNWARRPLKKTQLYYAALDADVCLALFDKLEENSQTERVEKLSLIKNEVTSQDKALYQFDFKKYAEYTKDPIFLVDNMLKKLSSTMRNCGLDTQFISIRDHQLIQSQSKKEKRIIITRDTKLAQRKGQNAAVYLLTERSDTETMFQEILNAFSIDLSNYKTLSRCVKCNGSDIIVISCEEALKEVKFSYQTKESNNRTYWRCAKCRQIYWQGGQFAKAKNKFDALKK